ncbi:MAG: DUF6603 domain-containing protein [Actinomycetota bacterium]
MAITDDLGAELAALGRAIGAIDGDGGLDERFFTQPDRQLGGILSDPDQRAAALDLLDQLVEGDSAAATDDAGRRWVPLATADGSPSGAYLVVDERPDPGGDPSATTVVLGVGGLVRATGPPAVEATVVVPLIEVRQGQSVRTAITRATGRLTGDVELDLGDLLAGSPFPVERVVVGLDVPTDGTDPSVEVRLALPPGGPDGDVRLDSGAGDIGPQVLELLNGLVVAAAGQGVGPAVDRLRSVLALLGLGADAAIPDLPLDRIVAEGPGAIWSWFRQLASTDAAIAAWAGHLADLLDLAAPTGAGTPADPVSLCHTAGPVTVCARVAIDRSDGNPVLVPSFSASIDPPAGAPAAAEAELAVEVARLRLTDQPEAVLLPSLSATARIGEVDGATKLVDTTVAPFGPVVVDAVRTGLTLDLTSSTPGLAFVLEALGVTIASDVYPRLDLTSADALVSTIGSALDGVVDSVLTALGGSEPAAAILALAGLRPPTGADGSPLDPATWPHGVAIGDFFADPVGALVDVHRRAIEAGDWGRLAGELARLLGVDGAVTVGGTGSSGNPWTVALATASPVGRVDLLAWSTDGADGRRLHLGLAIEPAAVDVDDDVDLTIGLRLEALSVRLAGPGGSAAPGDPAVLSSVDVTLGLGDDLLIELDVVSITVQSVDAGLRWTSGGGFEPVLAIVGATVEAGGVVGEIPIPTWDPATRTFGFDGDVPWDVVQALLAQGLAALENAAAAEAANLLGWTGGADPIGGGGSRPVLALAELVTEPVPALARWLHGLLSGADGRALADQVLGWLSDLALDVVPEGDAGITGAGSASDPWRAPLTADGHLGVVADIGRSGPPIDGIRPRLIPGFLEAAVDDDDPELFELTDVALMLGDAAPRFGPLRRTLAGRDPEALFTALRDRLGGSDGLVDEASALGYGSTTTTVEPASQLELPAMVVLDTHLPGGPGPAATVFLANRVDGLAPWPGQDGAEVIDLTGPGGDAIDLSAVPATGPWFAVLPSGDQTGFAGSARWDDLADRLRRLLDRIAAIRPAGPALAVVAHGPTGHVARLVSQDQTAGIGHLLTVGTPHGGADVTWADDAVVGDAVRLVQSLRGLATEATGDLALADQLLGVVGLVVDGAPPASGGGTGVGLAVDDLVPPPGLTGPPAGLQTASVAGRLQGDDIDLAVAEVAMAAVRGTPVEAPGLDQAVDDDPQLAVGLVADLVVPTGPTGSLRVGLSARLDAVRAAVQEEGDPFEVTGPRLAVTAVIDRAGGWLVGGPGSPGRVAGEPRVRAAEIRVTVDLLSGATEVDVDLLDASVYGIDRSLWRLGLPDPTSGVRALRPEERTLLGRAAAGLGVVPATGPVRAMIDLLVALGVGRLAADGTFELDVDPVERAIVDPGILLTDLTPVAARRSLTQAVASLLGVTAVDDRVTATVGPVEVSMQLVGADPSDPTEATLTLATAGDGLAIGGGLTLDASIGVSVDGPTASVELAARPGPAGQPVLRAVVDPTTADGAPPVVVDVELRSGLPALPAVVPLYPVPDGTALARLAGLVVPAEVVRTALELARSGEPAVADLLDALGLGRPDQPLRLPAGLLVDPAGWFLHDTVLGLAGGTPDPARLRALLRAAAGLLPGTHPTDGLALPFGLSVTVSESPAVPAGFSIGFDAPFDTGAVRLGGALAIGFAAGGGLRAGVDTTVELLDGPGGAGLGALTIALGQATGLQFRIGSGGSATVIDLLPTASGLGDLVTAAATAALPIALDALTEVTIDGFDLGDLVADIGDALGLRTGAGAARGFDQAELASFAAQPVARFASAAPGLADAVGGLVDPFLPGTVTSAGGATTLTFAAGVSVGLDLSGPLPVVEVRGFGLEPIAGLAVGGTVRVSDRLLLLAADVSVAVDDFVSTGGVSLLPFAGFSLGPESVEPAGRVDLGLWLASPAAGDRDGVVVQIPIGAAASVRCRTVVDGGTGDPADDTVTDRDDLAACALHLTARYLLPLAVDLVLTRDEVRALLERPVVSGGPTAGALVARRPADEAEALVVRETGPVRYRLAADLIDPDDLEALGQRFLATLFHAIGQFSVGFEIPGLAPVRVGVASAPDGRIGFRITIPDGQEFVVVDGDVRLSLEVDDTWVYEIDGQPEVPDTGGIEFFLLDRGGGRVDVDPLFRIRGLGLRIGRSGNANLLDGALTIGAVAVHGLFELDARGGSQVRGGGQIRLDRFAIPLGSGGDGGNPVAQGLLSDGGEGGDSGASDGDGERLAPAFSPSLAVAFDGSSTDVLFRAGPGDGPWWLPIQRGFGPLYVDQVGIGRTIDDAGGERNLIDVSFLIDGGASLAGLTVQVDDLSLTVPWATASRPGTWKVDLAGMAVGYQGGGVSVSGGFSRFTVDNSVEYRGLASVRYSVYGATAIGAYGEFPDGTGGRYSSFFVFAAVNAPIGGPPPFFVTGLGGGMGINRRLLAPPSIDEIADYPLVEALDSNSSLAQDPMQALEDMGRYFPPERGSLWFAAGIEFTSFALVRSVAVLTAEINDGLEINLLGLSNMTLPVPATPMVQIELALQARFSTEEGLFSIQAQLTDNSWLINESCRLTGGFAFVVWFSGSNAGQFVLTLGGYHPRFAKPSSFPDVPRLGFAWEPGGGVVIKGTSYFALTSSAVMAGGELEVAYRSGAIWARLALGANFLISWDPFHYDIEFYVEVSAGLKWRVCFFVCGTIRLSFSFGVRVHIVGPKLRGTATLDLDVTSITVRFGPSGSTNDCRFIGWDDFADKYVLSPPEQPGQASTREVVAGTVMRGELAGESGTDDPERAPDGSVQRPWQVEPEFGLVLQTRAATNAVRYGVLDVQIPAAIASTRYDLGPMGVVGVDSTLTVFVRRSSANGTNVSANLRVSLIEGKVPEAMWRVVPCDDAEPSANLLPSVTGLEIDATPFVPRTFIEADIDGIDEGKIVHPLPLRSEQAASAPNRLLGQLRQRAGQFRQQVVGAPNLVAAAKLMAEGDGPLTEQTFRAAVLEDWVAPPRVGTLSDDLADPERGPVTAEALPVVVDEAPVPDPTRIRPRVAAVLTPAEGLSGAEVSTGVGRTTARRLPAPTLADVRAGVARSVGSELLSTGVTARTVRSTVMVAGLAPGAGVTGPGRERHRRLGLDPALRAQLGRIEGRLAGAGHRVPPGDVLVLDLHPGEARVDEPDRIVVDDGQPLRLVAVDRGGNVLVDRVSDGGVVELPTRASRLLATIVAPSTASVGWLTGSRLAKLSDRTWVGAGCVVRGGAPPARRRSAAVSTGVVAGGDGPGRGRRIDTLLGQGMRSVAVVIEGIAADGALPEFALSGAARAVDDDGQPLAPALIETADASVMVVAITPTRGRRVDVRIGVADGQHLAGVVGSALPADELAARVARNGVAGVGPGPLAAVTGAGNRITWEAGS